MRLTAELFQQISKQLNGDPSVRSNGQVRTEPRVGLRAWAFILAELCDDTAASKPLKVQVTDLGWGGIGLVTPFRLPRGATFVLYLPRSEAHHGAPLLVRYSVAHAQPISNGSLMQIGGKVIEAFDAPPVGVAPTAAQAETMPRLSEAMRRFASSAAVRDGRHVA